MILAGTKELVPKSQLKAFSPGNFPECSVKVLYEQYKEHPQMKMYLPPKLCRGRTLDKAYFFNIFNTFAGDELEAIIRHAQQQRLQTSELKDKQETIKICEEMAEKLFQFPFVSVSIPTGSILILYVIL